MRGFAFFVIGCSIYVLAILPHAIAADPIQTNPTQTNAAQVLVVIGPSNHPPGSHEVSAGGRLMADCINRAQGLLVNAGKERLRAEAIASWPTDRAVLDAARTLVFIGDTFPGERMEDSERVMNDIATMMKRGCGIVCVHYATGLRAEDVADDGDHPLLHWMGGYFATRCKHHQSIAKIYSEALITPSDEEHPLKRGWKAFQVNDEPYINNYFGKDGNRLAVSVTPIAVSMLPPEKPQKEIVAWATTRADGGRGFGIVMPHFYRNWRQDDLRKLIMNAVVWTAGLDVPADGVRTEAPDLARYAPESVEPRPRVPAGGK